MQKLSLSSALHSRISGSKIVKLYKARSFSRGCRFFFECKMGYEYHRRSHGTRVLSPRRKNPEEEGESEEARRGRVRPPGRLAMSSGCLPRWWIIGESWRAQSQGRSAASATTAVAGAAVTSLVSSPRVPRPSPSPRKTTPASRHRDQPWPW